MLFRIGLGAVLVAIIEIWLIVAVAGAIGGSSTVLLLIVLSAGGAWIVKREGLMALRRLRGNMRDGHFPTSEVIDGFLILVAGALLLPPGFLTGFVGLLLVIPPVRRLAGRSVSSAVRARVAERIPPWQGPRPTGAGPWQAGGGSPGSPPSAPRDGDVLDVEGEEVDLRATTELDPSRRD